LGEQASLFPLHSLPPWRPTLRFELALRSDFERNGLAGLHSIPQEKTMELNDLTYLINAAVFEVNRELGPGFLEKVYENALLLELSNKGLKARSQAPIKIKYKGTEVVTTMLISL
jgi:hypothetical protein